MKKAIWILIVSAALMAGVVNAQAPQSWTRLSWRTPVSINHYSGTILNVSADKITIADGENSYAFTVNADTTCGEDNALTISDLEVGQSATVFYTWYWGQTLPTAIHIDPAL